MYQQYFSPKCVDKIYPLYRKSNAILQFDINYFRVYNNGIIYKDTCFCEIPNTKNVITQYIYYYINSIYYGFRRRGRFLTVQQ